MSDEIRRRQREILAYQCYLSRQNDPIYHNADASFDWYVAGLAMSYFENPYETEWTKYNENDYGQYRKFLTEEYKEFIKTITKEWEYDCNSGEWRI